MESKILHIRFFQQYRGSNTKICNAFSIIYKDAFVVTGQLHIFIDLH